MPELGQRTLTAIVLAPMALWWLLFAPSPWFGWLLGIATVAALSELVFMLTLPLRLWFVLTAAISIALMLAGEHATVAILALGMMWMALLMVATGGLAGTDMSAMVNRLALAYWMAVWLLLFMWTLLLIHKLPFGGRFLLGAFIGVWASDIAAYFAGKRFGRHRLCPSISPGKTVEGALAGILLGVPAAAAIWCFFTPSTINRALLLGCALVVAGILGDVAESAVKRSIGVKDSGHILPGHGGLLDRIDALVPAVSIAGLLWIGL